MFILFEFDNYFVDINILLSIKMIRFLIMIEFIGQIFILVIMVIVL